MREPLAIRLQNVSKIYKLHGSQSDQLIDVLGLQRFGIKTKTPSKEFAALSDISLDVPRGHRIGIVGRNGAGKTTLLKLICGNFASTSGEVEVNGTVQALMNIGLGFHPEYTGRENVEASLQYNGLARDEYQKAMEGIVDFCELGDFLDQPLKTYSLGMQARLMFASATAIKPDILIVDEVLGAGDAYFVAKSKARIEGLVDSGCTMLLVSHSMQQILELCDEAIWLDQGQVRMRDNSFNVVKAYEEYIHSPSKISQLSNIELCKNNFARGDHVSTKFDLETGIVQEDISGNRLMQVPSFYPNRYHVTSLPVVNAPSRLNFQTKGGVSRWQSDVGIKLCGFTVVTEKGEGNVLFSLRPARFLLNIVGECDIKLRCRYGIVFNDHSGNCVIRIYSPVDYFSIQEGECHMVEMTFNPLQLGPGEYVVGISILDDSSIETVNSAKRYDLLGRSFEMRVEAPESLLPVTANFFHTAEWGFGK